MKRSTSVRRHSRRGTKGVKQHTREIDSSYDKRVPHDVVSSEDLNLDEEKEEDKDQNP